MILPILSWKIRLLILNYAHQRQCLLAFNSRIGVGINPKKNYHAGPRPVPLVAEGSKAISTVLA